jgi:hypothetical protein
MMAATSVAESVDGIRAVAQPSRADGARPGRGHGYGGAKASARRAAEHAGQPRVREAVPVVGVNIGTR